MYIQIEIDLKKMIFFPQLHLLFCYECKSGKRLFLQSFFSVLLTGDCYRLLLLPIQIHGIKKREKAQYITYR